MLIGRSYGGNAAISTPFNKTRPEVGVSNPASMRNKVDFPHPELPSKAKISPFWIAIETSETARTSSKRLTRFSVSKKPGW